MARSDPNMMTSTLMSFVRKHWFASIKVAMVYFIVIYCTSIFNVGDGFYTLLSVALLLLWIYFDFCDITRLAMRDVNLVKYEYIKYDRWKGLKTGLIAQIPGLLLCILIIITRSSAGRYGDWLRMFYFILYSPAAQLVGRYAEQTLAVFFAPLPVIPLVSVFAYYCGYHEIPLWTRIVYKNREKNKKLQ